MEYIKCKLKPLYTLESNYTNISSTMIMEIEDPYYFKVYFYLLSKFNNEHTNLPSLNTISEDTNVSKRKVQDAIKWLEDNKYIERYKNKRDNMYTYSIWYTPSDGTNGIEKDGFKNTIEKDDEVIFCDIEIEQETKKKNKQKSRKDSKYQTWRRRVLKRDDYTCQLCGCTDEDSILNVHHIERYADNEELRTDVNNGITLCCNCHMKIYGKEKEYKEYFKKIIQNLGKISQKTNSNALQSILDGQNFR